MTTSDARNAVPRRGSFSQEGAFLLHREVTSATRCERWDIWGRFHLTGSLEPVRSKRGLLHEAEKKWRRLNGHTLLAQVIEGVKFTDGEIKVSEAA